jgi:hypothetical protein
MINRERAALDAHLTREPDDREPTHYMPDGKHPLCGGSRMDAATTDPVGATCRKCLTAIRQAAQRDAEA